MFASLHRDLCDRWNKKRVKGIIFEVYKRGGFAWVTINTGSHDVATNALIKNVKAKIKENTNWKDDKTIHDLVFNVLRILHQYFLRKVS